MSRSRERKCVEMKLCFLKEQKCQLHSLIDEKIDKVITAGEAWLWSGHGDTRRPFGDMSQMIEEAVEFVAQMFTEIEADESETNYLKCQVKKMEDDIKPLMINQTNLGNEMADLSVKQSNTQDIWMKQFSLVTDKVTDLTQKADGYIQQHNRQIESLREELKTVGNSQDDLKKNVAERIISTETLQASLDLLQQDMGNVQVDVQKLRGAIQEQGEAVLTSKLKEITDEISSLKRKTQSLELKCPGPVGFSVHAQDGYRPTKGAGIRWHNFVRCNTDNSFNVKTGIFTAPIKGMYTVCLNLWQSGNGEMSLEVLKKRKSSTSVKETEREVLFLANTVRVDSSDTDFIVTEVDVGDTIHVEVAAIKGAIELNDGTKFTCFLVS